MANNYRSRGDRITVTTLADVVSGAFILHHGFFGIAANTAKSATSDKVTILLEGVFLVPISDAVANEGILIYAPVADDTTVTLTTNPSGAVLVGKSMEAKDATKTGYVKMRLAPQIQTD